MSKKEELLQIAANEFSKYGYEGASLERIAKRVGITKAAIYYHFKDKDALYEAVLLYRLENLVAHIQQHITASNTEEQLRQYIESFGAFLQEYPCFAAILAHEFADDGKHMSKRVAQSLSKTLTILTSIFNDGIKKEVFELENPMVVQMMVVSTLIMHQTTTNLRKKVTKFVEGHKILPEPDIHDLSKIVARKIIKALRKTS